MKEILLAIAIFCVISTVVAAFAITAGIQLDEHLYERSLREKPDPNEFTCVHAPKLVGKYMGPEHDVYVCFKDAP